jgi:hypothetical protein
MSLWDAVSQAIALPPQQEDWMATFSVYMDDSGKFANPKNRYTTICGYVAHVSEWGRFHQEWMNCRFQWQVPPIHMSAIMYPDRDAAWQKVKDEWGATWEAKRERMLLEFGGIIVRSAVNCVGAVVDAEHYRSMPKSKFTDTLNPLSFSFQWCIIDALNMTKIVDENARMNVVIDDDRESSLHCYEILHRLKEGFPDVKKRVDGVAFVDDQSYSGVQAADMIAYESRQLMEAKSKDAGAESSELFKSLTRWGIHQPRLFTAAVLDQWASGGLAEIEAQNKP